MAWEYKVLQIQESATHGLVGGVHLEGDLNEIAREGWELFQVVTYSTAERAVTINHYFRRETKASSSSGPAPGEEGSEDQE
jgi:hypothetical protein